MKRFLVKVGLFAFLFGLLNLLYWQLIRTYDWNFIKRIEAIQLEPKDYDCVVLGSSLAMDGIDTGHLTSSGWKSYNLAIGGASLKTNWVQLSEYLNDAQQKPKIVLLGLGSCIQQHFDDDRVTPIVQTTSANYIYGLRDIPMLKFRWLAKELIKKIISPQHREIRVVSGQMKIKKQTADRSDFMIEQDTLTKSNYHHSTYLSKIVALCQQHQIRLVLLEMPGIKKSQNNIPIGPHLIDSSTELYNFNNREFCQFIDSNSDWVGNSHLNEQGALKFTKRIFPLIINP